MAGEQKKHSCGICHGQPVVSDSNCGPAQIIPCPGLAETGPDSQLAGELRTTIWACDDMAVDLPAGRATPERMNELADRLSGMAAVLRLRAGTQQHRQALEQQP